MERKGGRKGIDGMKEEKRKKEGMGEKREGRKGREGERKDGRMKSVKPR